MPKEFFRVLAGWIAAAPLLLTGSGNLWAQNDSLSPNNLVVSRSVYAGSSTSVAVGQTLPAGCLTGTVTLPTTTTPPGTTTVKITTGSSGCTMATYDGTYPTVFNNALVDGSFGITSPIYLDQMTTNGTVVGTIPIDRTQIVTSFSSKSEVALNLSQDHNSITFVGYVGGPGCKPYFPLPGGGMADALSPTEPNLLDVSNSNTPGVCDPTNPVVSSFSSTPIQGTAYYRSVAEVNAAGSLVSITEGNAYSGNNGRAAIKALNGMYYLTGNGNNGGLSKTQLPETTVGQELITSTGVELLVPGQVPPVPPNINQIGNFSITQVDDNAADKPGKDNNFRGLTIFNDTLYVTKGSGGNGINTVYQVGCTGQLPTPANAPGTCAPAGTSASLLNVPISILPGFPTTLASAATGVMYPFGIFFANANTLYVADEGNGNIGTVSSSNPYADATPQNNPTAGLQKWVFNGTSWTLAYTLTNGLGLGVPYTVPGYPTGNNSAHTSTLFPGGLPWAPAPDGLRNIAGRVNEDGTVNIWAITSTVSGGGDQGADPNQLVFITDKLAATTAGTQQFQVLRTANAGEVLRGVSFAPGQPLSNPTSGNTCNGVYNGTFNGNITVSASQNCVFVGGKITGNVKVSGGNLSLSNASVGGNVQIQGGGTFSIGPATTIDGNLQVQNLPMSTGQNQICDAQIQGNLQVQSNGVAIVVGSPSCLGNVVGGNLQVQDNTAPTLIYGNTVSGNLQAQDNSAGTAVDSNSVGGNLQVQDNGAPTSVFSNNASGNLQCTGNAGFMGGGNTAKKTQGQCAGI